MIVDAQAAAEIEITNLRPFLFQLSSEHAIQILAHFGQSIDERRHRGELRTDVAIDADDIDVP